MRLIATIALGTLLARCAGLAPTSQGGGPELARPAAPLAADACIVRGANGDVVTDRQGNPARC